MTALKAFVVGVLTRHLPTKFLSLLLSMMVFAFVQNSLTGTRTIEELQLKFSLSTELSTKRVLLTESVILRNVTIEGLRSTVDEIYKDLKNAREVTITERFLREHDDQEDGRIRITATVLQDSAILGSEIRVKSLPSDARLRIDPLVERSDVRVQLAADAPIRLPREFEFQGTLSNGSVDVSIFPNRVTVEGPRSWFTAEATVLYLTLRPVREYLERNRPSLQGAEEKATVAMRYPNVWIDWAATGDDHLRRHVRITAPDVRAGAMTPAEFREALKVTFDVTAKMRQDRITVPILRRGEWSAKWPVEKLQSESTLVKTIDISAGEVAIDVRMPSSLWSREELIANLALVLDFAEARQEGDRLFVPFHLDVRDRTRTEDRQDVERIEIAAAPEEKDIRFRIEQ